MKKHMLLFFFILISFCLKSQVNGVIISDVNNIKLLKIWGSHVERGYAYGALLGKEINQVFGNYVKPQFGFYYPYARDIVESGLHLKFDSVFVVEAQSIVAGMNETGNNSLNLDYIDLLVCNSILDVSRLLSSPSGISCSTLMSWGDATSGTDLSGKSVITRHLDWTTSPTLVNNQVICVSQPSEIDEQSWVSVGFAGMFSVLSGFNEHMAVFQNMMDDFTGNASYGRQYEPIWFSLRKSVEIRDFNDDGKYNVQDVKSVLSRNSQGYAGAYLISAIAKSTEIKDSLIAMIAEISPAVPYLTFRNNDYADNIPGDNLYTANYQIARNNARNYCERYNGVVSAIGEGVNISTTSSWNIMRDYSHLSHNLQLMQYAPELDLFKIAIYGNNKPAYQNTPVSFVISDLFSDYTGVNDLMYTPAVSVFPNPVKEVMTINGLNRIEVPVRISVRDIAGKLVFSEVITTDMSSTHFNVSSFTEGVYIVEIKWGDMVILNKMIKE